MLQPPTLWGEDDDFASSAAGQYLINLGLKFIDDPGDFFMNLHLNNEDYSPLPDGRRVGARFNFFPTFFPTTLANLNLKINVLSDKPTTPQIDMVGTYGDLLGLRFAADSMEDVKPEFSDYAVGLVVSKKVQNETKLFAGFKYTQVQMKVVLSSSSAVDFGSFHLDTINFKVADMFIYSGICHQSGKDAYVIAQAGYGLTYKKIAARIMMSRKHLELGIDMFPEGMFVIHPFMAWHWYF